MFKTYDTISDALAATKSQFFGVTNRAGVYTANDSESFFGKKLPDPELTFDVSNNKVLANLSLDGTLKHLTVYHGNYYSDTIPGVWVCKEYSSTGPFTFGLMLNNDSVDITDEKRDFHTSLLANLIPVTVTDLGEVEMTSLAFAPISADGSQRLRGLIYAVYVTNKSDHSVEGSILLPTIERVVGEQFSGAEICVHLIDQYPSVTTHQGAARVTREEVQFDLAPNDSIWVPIYLCPLAEPSLQTVRTDGALHWLNQTLGYYQGIVGDLKMPDDPYTAEFFTRALMQCFGSIGMANDGNTVGSNWGSYPSTDFIWMKDMYYSFLPFAQLDPELFRKGMLWFFENGVRPPGNRFEGGILHSLSNSLSSVVMAGLYYKNTGDAAFFLDNPQVGAKAQDLLEQTLALRASDDPWLFPSIWISDAYSLGEYHTGSNIIAWVAFESFGRIVEEVYADSSLGRRYRLIAQNIRNAIEEHCVVEGPLGPQYLEGICLSEGDKTKMDARRYEGAYNDLGMQFIHSLVQDGKVNLMHHDGEESDTILIPVYNYAPYDHAYYRQYMQFSLSAANPVYNAESRGIQWGPFSACTFPGYMSGMGMIVDAEDLNGKEGRLTEVRRLTDVDGSLWWWPYGNGAKYGDVMRHNNCGKCGWASGVFASIFVSEILGLAADAPTSTLRFRPFSPASSFSWGDARIGTFLVDAVYEREGSLTSASVTNHSSIGIRTVIELPYRGKVESTNIFLDNTPFEVPVGAGAWNSFNTVIVDTELPVGSTIKICVDKGG